VSGTGNTPGPFVTFTQEWTTAQWNAFFASLAYKVDASGGAATGLTINNGILNDATATDIIVNGGTLSGVFLDGVTIRPGPGGIGSEFMGPQGPPGPQGASGGVSSSDARIAGAYIGLVIAGRPGAGQVIYVSVPFACVVNAGLAGTTVYDGTAATSNATFTVNRITAGNVSSALGSITVTNASHFSASTSGAGGTLAAGDAVQVVCPAVPDATLADLGITIAAVRI
jgi:hypothetical protein